MPCLNTDVTQALEDEDDEKTATMIEEMYDTLLKERVDFIEYGDPDKLTDKQKAHLNCKLLKQVLIHRAERLMVGSGEAFGTKNIYALALATRGHIEAVAVFGYFTRRLDSLIKENIEFKQFEDDIANGLMGARDKLFKEAKAPVNILTCVEHADKLFDADFFKEKKSMLEELYTWLSEFAHPNFCSNKSAFDLDKETGRMVLRKESELNQDHFQMLSVLSMSGSFFTWLIPQFDDRVAKVFAEA